jgi:hypothetical protein
MTGWINLDLLSLTYLAVEFLPVMIEIVGAGGEVELVHVSWG